MKKVLFVNIVLLLLLSSCFKTKSVPPVNKYLCNYSPEYNAKFNQIVRSSTYPQVVSLFGVNGDNWMNNSGAWAGVLINYYKWYPCLDHEYYVECLFRAVDGSLLSVDKAMANNSCGDSITVQSFAELKNGMTYENIVSILKDSGDRYRSDYPDSINRSDYYRFYNCSDKTKYFEIMFSDDSAISLGRNF